MQETEPRRAAIIVASDRAARGEREDAAGPAVRELLAREGYEVASLVVVSDEQAAIEAAIRDAAASDVALCVSSGGTGVAARDVTPEATAAVCERMVPGIGEAMRAASAKITPYAWLSRATAGILGRTLVVNVPGSPRAATENLEAVLAPIAHAIKVLRAEGPLDCAAERADAERVAGEGLLATKPAPVVAAAPAASPVPAAPTTVTSAALARRPCILFDFDGTLADTKAAIVATAERVLADWGLTPEEIGDAGRLVGPPFPNAYMQVYGFSRADAEEITRRYRAIYTTLGPETHRLFDGVAELLGELKAQGRRLAITSSKRRPMVVDMLADNDAVGYFEAIVAQTDPAHADKASLIADTLRELGCAPQEAVMVGDRHHDVAGALACGVPCVGVYYGNTALPGELEGAGAAACAATVAELRSILLGGIE